MAAVAERASVSTALTPSVEKLELEERVDVLTPVFRRIQSAGLLATGVLDTTSRIEAVALRWLLDRFHPRFLVHGHYDPLDQRVPRQVRYGPTVVVNACGHTLLEVADGL